MTADPLDRDAPAEPEVTTDPDGTDNSDILDIPYPQSDPHQWVRSPEDDAWVVLR